jgi:zinc transporter, ZIP family
MLLFFSSLSPVFQSLIATLFTWSLTALGAAGIFIFPAGNKKLFNATLGFTAGVMLAASFWSLLQPAINLSQELGGNAWLSPAIGFALGGAFFGRSIKLSLIYISVFLWLRKRASRPVGTKPCCCLPRLRCIIFQKDWQWV